MNYNRDIHAPIIGVDIRKYSASPDGAHMKQYREVLHKAFEHALLQECNGFSVLTAIVETGDGFLATLDLPPLEAFDLMIRMGEYISIFGKDNNPSVHARGVLHCGPFNMVPSIHSRLFEAGSENANKSMEEIANRCSQTVIGDEINRTARLLDCEPLKMFLEENIASMNFVFGVSEDIYKIIQKSASRTSERSNFQECETIIKGVNYKVYLYLVNEEISCEKIKNIDFCDDTVLWESIRTIREATLPHSRVDYRKFAEAIAKRMRATELNVLDPENLDKWAMNIPDVGLTPDRKKSLMLIRDEHEEMPDNVNRLIKDTGASLLIVVDRSSNTNRPTCAHADLIWFSSPDALFSMSAVTKDSLYHWFRRFIVTQNASESLLPFNTRGDARFFYGREKEKKLINDGLRFGLVTGATKSGKTSFLREIKRMLEKETKVIGPIIGSLNFLYETTGIELGTTHVTTLDAWVSAVGNYESINDREIIFLLDEVDFMIAEDSVNDYKTIKQMNELAGNKCRFFLAGHQKLREAIEQGLFANDSREIRLTGLTESESCHLMQELMDKVSFKISDHLAKRIFRGTAGIPYLIQEFCRRLLLFECDYGRDVIDEDMVRNIEISTAYLKNIYLYFCYPRDVFAISVMRVVALSNGMKREQIENALSANSNPAASVVLEKLNMLERFSVLRPDEEQNYKILPEYLTLAIRKMDEDGLGFSLQWGGIPPAEAFQD